MLQKIYQTIAAQVVESLREDRLDLDRFLPALHQEMLSCVRTIQKEADDYDPDDLNWAANQEREAKLFLDGLDEALGELGVVTRYGEETTDQLDMGHLRSAEATLRNLKRRMEA